MSSIAKDTTVALSLTSSLFRVFSVPELADVIISYLAKTAILSLRSVCRALHRVVVPSRWISVGVVSMTECFQDSLQDPLYEFKRINLRVLGSDKIDLGMTESKSLRRALRECPNITDLRLAFSWEECSTELKEFVIDALKDNVLAALQNEKLETMTTYFTDMKLSSQSVRNDNLLAQNVESAIGLKLLYLRFRPQEGVVLGTPFNLASVLDSLSTQTIEITPELVPSLERHPVLSRMVTPATPLSSMTLPILPQLTLLDISALHKQNFVVSWDSLVRFLATATPNLKELWLNKIPVQVGIDDSHENGPVITNLKILGFRFLIKDALAKRVVKTFPHIEQLSVYNITPFWLQTDMVSTDTARRWPMRKRDLRHPTTRAGNASATRIGAEQEDDEYKWTPFPFLKFLRLRSPNQKTRLKTLTDLVPLKEHQVPHCFNDLFLEGGHVEALQIALSLKFPPNLRLQRITILSHADWNPSVDKESDHIWAQFLLRPCCEEIRSLSLFHRTTIIQVLIAGIRNGMTSLERKAALMDDDFDPPTTQVEVDELGDSQEPEEDAGEREVKEILKLNSSESYVSVLRQSIRAKVSFACHLRSLRLQGYWLKYMASKALILDVNLFLHCCPRLTDFWMLDGSVSDVDLLFKGLGRCPESSPQRSTDDGSSESLKTPTNSEIILDKGLHDVSWINGERPHLQRLQLGMSVSQDNGDIERSLRARFRHMDILCLFFQ